MRPAPGGISVGHFAITAGTPGCFARGRTAPRSNRVLMLSNNHVLAGAGLSKSALSRRFVALSAERMTEWMASDLSKLELQVIQIDGIHIAEDLVLLAAIGVNGAGDKHPLGVIEGATENATVVQALIDNR